MEKRLIMEFISTAKGLGRGGLIFIVLELLRQIVPQLTSPYSRPIMSLLLFAVSFLILGLIHFPIILAIRRCERQAVRSGATLIVYGLIWLISCVAAPSLGILTGVLFTLGGILALVGANSANYQAQHAGLKGAANTASSSSNFSSGFNATPFYATPSAGVGATPGGSNSSKSSTGYGSSWNSYSGSGSTIPLPDFGTVSKPSVSFAEAVALAQAGRKQEAYKALKELETASPNDINVLLWVAFTAPNSGEAQRAISAAARIAPGNSSVIQAQQWLNRLPV